MNDSKITKELLEKSLTNTRPYRIDSAGSGSATGLSGYALQVESDITITSLSSNLRGDVPTSMVAGVYYIRVNAIVISAGSCIVYEHELPQG